MSNWLRRALLLFCRNSIIGIIEAKRQPQRTRMHRTMRCSVRRALYAMQLVPNQCADARSAGAGGQHGMPWPRHGHMQRRSDSGFTWAACCMLHDVRCTLHAAWCVRVCYAVKVGAAASGAGWLPSGCTRWARAGAVARCMSAWHSRGCRAAGVAMRRSLPSWCSSEPTWRCRTPSGVLLDRVACIVQACIVQACTVQADTVQRATGALDRALCKVHRCGRQRATCSGWTKRATLSSCDAAGRR